MCTNQECVQIRSFINQGCMYVRICMYVLTRQEYVLFVRTLTCVISRSMFLLCCSIRVAVTC